MIKIITATTLIITIALSTYVKTIHVQPKTTVAVTYAMEKGQERESDKSRKPGGKTAESKKPSISPTPTPTVYSRGNSGYAEFAAFQVYDPESKSETMAMATEMAKTYKIDPESFLCVLNAESGIESKRRDTGELKCGDGGRSCGIGQIQLPTWKSIRRHAGWSQEDLRADDYENIRTTAYGISTVWREHWTGVKKCRSLGYKL